MEESTRVSFAVFCSVFQLHLALLCFSAVLSFLSALRPVLAFTSSFPEKHICVLVPHIIPPNASELLSCIQKRGKQLCMKMSLSKFWRRKKNLTVN